MKRKVLISVLAVVLVLVLSVGMLVACNKGDGNQSATKYDVSFSLGEYDGTGSAPATQQIEAGKKVTLPEVGVEWENHSFLGWKYGENIYAPGEEVEVNGKMEFVAQWDLLEYITITFVAGEYQVVWDDVIKGYPLRNLPNIGDFPELEEAGMEIYGWYLDNGEGEADYDN